MNANAIETQALSKHFAPGVGVSALTLSVPPGEVFGFLGPNGAGKTTTIRTLLGFLRPTGGEGRIFGLDVWQAREAVHARVGYLPGEVHLNPAWTTQELLARGARLRGLRDVTYGLEVARRLDLDLTRRVGTLSKGNRQKVGVTLALMHRPDLLILDEPTDGLDPLVQDTVLALLREARAEGRTVFLSSHVLSEVERVADRVGIIRAGGLVRVDRLPDLKASLPQRLHVTFAAAPGADLAALPGLTVTAAGPLSVEGLWRGDPNPLLRALAGEQVRALSFTPSSLEDAFMDEYRTGGPHVA